MGRSLRLAVSLRQREGRHACWPETTALGAFRAWTRAQGPRAGRTLGRGPACGFRAEVTDPQEPPSWGRRGGAAASLTCGWRNSGRVSSSASSRPPMARGLAGRVSGTQGGSVAVVHYGSVTPSPGAGRVNIQSLRSSPLARRCPCPPRPSLHPGNLPSGAGGASK